MSWRESLQEASFRSVRFFIDTSSAGFGRRGTLHEYPFKNAPYAEDIGKKAKTFNITAYLHGENYITQRNALIKAIENNSTAGTLIHPTLGSFTVKPTADCTVSWNGKEGGFETFNLVFVEAGNNEFPATNENTNSRVTTLSNVVKTDVFDLMSVLYKVAGFGGFVKDSASALFEQYFDKIDVIRKNGGKITGKANEFKALFDTFQDSIDTLTNLPSDLAQSTVDFFDSFESIFSDPEDSYQAFKSVFEIQPFRENIIYNTPNRIQQKENNDIIVQAFRSLSVAKMSNASIETEFLSIDKVTERKTELAEVFEAQIDEAGIEEQTVLRRDLVFLRSAVINNLNDRGASLPEFKDISLNFNIPAVREANELYGDQSRSQEIIDNNNVQNPLFLPNDLRVLSF